MFLSISWLDTSARHSFGGGQCSVEITSSPIASTKKWELETPTDWQGVVFTQEGKQDIVINPEVPEELWGEIWWRLAPITSTWFTLPQEIIDNWAPCNRPHKEYGGESYTFPGDIKYDLKRKNKIIPKWLEEYNYDCIYFDELEICYPARFQFLVRQGLITLD